MSASGFKATKLRALYEKILLRPFKEETSYGGIHMVEPGPHSKLTLRMAEVVDVGDGGERVDGCVQTREHRVKRGDVIIYAWAGSVPVLVTVEDSSVPSGFRREEWRYITVDHIYGLVEGGYRPETAA